MRHPAWASLFDLAAGRGAGADREHAEGCARCGRTLGLARLLLGLGRSARAVPAPGAAARRLAEARIAQRGPVAEGAPSAVPLLALVFDSFARAAPAVRSAAVAPERYLRWEGSGLALDLRVRRAAAGRELHGAVEPAGAASRAVVIVGEHRREAAIGPDGEFVLRRLPAGPLRLELDGRATDALDS